MPGTEYAVCLFDRRFLYDNRCRFSVYSLGYIFCFGFYVFPVLSLVSRLLSLLMASLCGSCADLVHGALGTVP